MSTWLRSSMIALVAAASAVVIATAQNIDPKKVPGNWKPFPMSRLQRPYQSPAWLTLAVVKDLGARLNDVAEVFHRTPYMASPMGWVMFLRAQVHLDRSWPHPTRSEQRWVVAGRLGLWASHFEDDGRTVYDAGSEFVLNFSANDLTCALNNAGEWATDAEGSMFLEVETPAERIEGYPRYQQCLLITHRPAPMFVPVTMERVINVRIAEIERRVAPVREALAMTKGRTDTNASMTQSMIDAVATWDEIVKELRARLAKMTPDERRGPAFASSAVVVEDPLNLDTGRRVVEANPAFFDPARPADIQVLTMFNDCVHDGCSNYPIVQKMFAQLDWKALAAIVR